MTKQIERVLFIVCICVALASCNTVNAPTTITVSALPALDITPLPILSQTSTLTSTAFLTQTLEPTATLTPLPVLPQPTSESEILEPTATLTPLPVLSQPASEKELKELLQNDTDCKLPCFLGVIPEKTTIDELKNIFNHFGVPLHDYEGKGLAYAIEQFPSSEVPPETGFYLGSGLVQSMRVYLDQSNQFEWSIYSPLAMLTRLGAPSKVTFGLQVIHEPSPTPLKAWYHMTFFYDDLDLIIDYGTAEIRLGELITVCPNKDDFQGAIIWLGEHPYYPPLPDTDGPLEDVTTFTLESFRDYLLLGPGACFDLKASAIPIY